MSCEGHDDSEAIPWIGFNTASHIPQAEDIQLEQLEHLLDEFYQERSVPHYLQLGVYNDVGGERSGQYTLMSSLGHESRHLGQDIVGERTRAHLEDQQKEMADFAQFLRDKFLSGFTIQVPEYREGNGFDY